ncbi:hypothetical protein SCP_0507570 [Sparassis crispa]|uniref:Uncharacterized protein n=1 Tax=Sparassis crispa TaxID=139825 RepID=A0A401GN82_9APHY|nr:hypothetical protein SCP_0507570 [Sparassis crispa]GBE83701.1 hypothetical protein SCP_0507570 [Sparassis crispa]
MGERLKDIYLAFFSEKQVEIFSRSCCLSLCVNVETLGLILPVKNDLMDPYVHLPLLLSQISPRNHLRHLMFSTRLSLQGDMIDYNHLRDIDAILAQETFRNLREVDFELFLKCNSPPLSTRSQVLQGVKSAMSGIFGRGVGMEPNIIFSYIKPSSWDERCPQGDDNRTLDSAGDLSSAS